MILNEKLGVLQNVFPTNSSSMINVALQTSEKFVTKVNLTFVTFSMSHSLYYRNFQNDTCNWNHSREIKLKDQTGLKVASRIIILYVEMVDFKLVTEKIWNFRIWNKLLQKVLDKLSRNFVEYLRSHYRLLKKLDKVRNPPKGSSKTEFPKNIFEANIWH